SSLRLVAVSVSSRCPTRRSRSTARKVSTSTSCEETTRSPDARGIEGGSRSKNRTRRMALASTYFTGIFAHGMKRCLDIDTSAQRGNLERAPILGAGTQPTSPRQSLVPRRGVWVRRPELGNWFVAVLDRYPSAT